MIDFLKIEQYYNESAIVLARLCDIYMKSLFDNKIALSYCADRGISLDMIKKFKIGYDPGNIFTSDLFTTFQIDKEYLQKIGVIKESNNAYYSLFSQRLIFPVQDLKGNIIGIIGRSINDSTPKYLISKNSYAFQKSLSLYGLYQSYRNILTSNVALVVEGNIDVISCHKIGINYAVCSFGTSFMYTHLLLLRAFTNNIIFCFDNDEAGKSAKDKIVKLLNRVDDIKVGFLDLEGAKDPDEFIHKHFSNGKLLKESIEDLKKQMI